MREIITYRLSATGVWGYEFYHPDRTLIGSVSSVLAPSAAVRIEGGPIQWYSRFDIDTRIVPGIGRKIKDNRTGDDRSVQVEIRKDAYLFGKPMMPVTAMTERITEADWIPANHMEVKPYFRTTVYEEISEEYLMMVLSFPALRMC